MSRNIHHSRWKQDAVRPMIPFTSPQLVAVEWIEARGSSWRKWEPVTHFGLQGAVYCVAVGFQIADTPKTITIVPAVKGVERDGFGDLRGALEIPRQAVCRIAPVQVGAVAPATTVLKDEGSREGVSILEEGIVVFDFWFALSLFEACLDVWQGVLADMQPSAKSAADALQALFASPGGWPCQVYHSDNRKWVRTPEKTPLLLCDAAGEPLGFMADKQQIAHRLAFEALGFIRLLQQLRRLQTDDNERLAP